MLWKRKACYYKNIRYILCYQGHKRDQESLLWEMMIELRSEGRGRVNKAEG